jgi:transposase InsO family protein
LPGVEGSRPRQRFAAYPIGYIHIDLAEVWTHEGRLYLFVAVDRVSKFAYAELRAQATRRVAAEFFSALLARVPYRVHTVLTDNGFQFRPPEAGWTVAEIQDLISRQQPFRGHAFELVCARHHIDHRFTKFNHPWTNGQVERMVRTIREATVRRYYYETHKSLRAHLSTFLEAYNFTKRLKSLRALTPYERVCQLWPTNPERFTLNPLHDMPGLNI